MANYGFSPEIGQRMMRDPVEPSGWTMVGRVLAEGKAVHVLDAQADSDERMTQMAIISRTRSFLGAPLLREGVAVGVLLLQRSTVQPFTDKEIELATTFADQASIAILPTATRSMCRCGIPAPASPQPIRQGFYRNSSKLTIR